MRLDVILRVCSKLFIPFILVFAFYVQFHGDYGPGGGFQAGVIIAAGVILYAIIYGLRRCKTVMPVWLIELLLPLGVLLYSGVGVWSMVMGTEFLNYNRLIWHDREPDAIHGQHWGVFLVELGVLITVASTMVALFYAFAGRGRADDRPSDFDGDGV